jgi:hypothetical protein
MLDMMQDYARSAEFFARILTLILYSSSSVTDTSSAILFFISNAPRVQMVRLLVPPYYAQMSKVKRSEQKISDVICILKTSQGRARPLVMRGYARTCGTVFLEIEGLLQHVVTRREHFESEQSEHG